MTDDVVGGAGVGGVGVTVGGVGVTIVVVGGVGVTVGGAGVGDVVVTDDDGEGVIGTTEEEEVV